MPVSDVPSAMFSASAHKLLSLTVALSMAVATLSYGQQAGRKVIYQVAPAYPPILKEKFIGGVVRILAVVSPAGTVKETRMLGGNPVLVAAGVRAVKLWKFAPGPNETQQTITLKFDPFTSHKD